MQPDTAPRTELKHWVFEHIYPCREHTTAFVIRKLVPPNVGSYYCGTTATPYDGQIDTTMWTPNINSHTVRQYPRVEDARAQFHWKLWLGNWIESFLPKKWRRVIPWRLFEIVEVYNIWEHCDIEAQEMYPCRHRRTYL